MSVEPTDKLMYRGKNLRDWLSDLDAAQEPARRAQLAGALGELGAELLAWLPHLRATLKAMVLKDREETVRGSALLALVQLGPQATSQIPALIDTLRDEVAAMRLSAAHALRELGPSAVAAVPTLITTALRDAELAVRLEAAVALWKIDKKHANITIPVLKQALESEDEIKRWTAADCLGEMGPEAQAAAPALQAALAKPFKSALIRMSLELALGRLQG